MVLNQKSNDMYKSFFKFIKSHICIIGAILVIPGVTFFTGGSILLATIGYTTGIFFSTIVYSVIGKIF